MTTRRSRAAKPRSVGPPDPAGVAQPARRPPPPERPASDDGANGERRLLVTVDGLEPLVIELEPAPVVAAERPPDPTARAVAPRTPGVARYEVVVDGWRFEVDVEWASRAALRARAANAGQRGPGAGRQVVRAQIPGRVLSVGVAVGQSVEAGQALLVVEAMKMENLVAAPWPGTIARVGIVAGQTVERGDELVVIE